MSRGGRHCRDRRVSPTGGGDLLQRTINVREDDDVVRIPCAAEASGYVAELLGQAATRGDFFELARRKEPDVPAVRRPEGTKRTIGSGKLPPDHVVERPDPQHVRAVRDDDERDLSAIGRNGEGRGETVASEPRILGRSDLKLERWKGRG